MFKNASFLCRVSRQNETGTCFFLRLMVYCQNREGDIFSRIIELSENSNISDLKQKFNRTQDVDAFTVYAVYTSRKNLGSLSIQSNQQNIIKELSENMKIIDALFPSDLQWFEEIVFLFWDKFKPIYSLNLENWDTSNQTTERNEYTGQKNVFVSSSTKIYLIDQINDPNVSRSMVPTSFNSTPLIRPKTLASNSQQGETKSNEQVDDFNCCCEFFNDLYQIPENAVFFSIEAQAKLSDYLEKKSMLNSTFRTKWVMANEQYLYYSEPVAFDRGLSFISLRDIKNKQQITIQQNSFILSLKSGEKHIFRAASVDIATKWVDWIKNFRCTSISALDIYKDFDNSTRNAELRKNRIECKIFSQIATIEGLLQNTILRKGFQNFLTESFCHDSLLFWMFAEEYKICHPESKFNAETANISQNPSIKLDHLPEETKDQKSRCYSIEIIQAVIKCAKMIQETFIIEESFHEIDVKNEERIHIHDCLVQAEENLTLLPINLFSLIQERMMELMRTVKYIDFIMRPEYKNLLLLATLDYRKTQLSKSLQTRDNRSRTVLAPKNDSIQLTMKKSNFFYKIKSTHLSLKKKNSEEKWNEHIKRQKDRKFQAVSSPIHGYKPKDLVEQQNDVVDVPDNLFNQNSQENDALQNNPPTQEFFQDPTQSLILITDKNDLNWFPEEWWQRVEFNQNRQNDSNFLLSKRANISSVTKQLRKLYPVWARITPEIVDAILFGGFLSMNGSINNPIISELLNKNQLLEPHPNQKDLIDDTKYSSVNELNSSTHTLVALEMLHSIEKKTKLSNSQKHQIDCNNSQITNSYRSSGPRPITKFAFSGCSGPIICAGYVQCRFENLEKRSSVGNSGDHTSPGASFSKKYIILIEYKEKGILYIFADPNNNSDCPHQSQMSLTLSTEWMVGHSPNDFRIIQLCDKINKNKLWEIQPNEVHLDDEIFISSIRWFNCFKKFCSTDQGQVESEILMQGFLSKKGFMSTNQKKFWVVLTSTLQLQFYKEDGSLEMEMNMEKCKKITSERSTQILIDLNGSKTNLIVDPFEEANDWVIALNNVLKGKSNIYSQDNSDKDLQMNIDKIGDIQDETDVKTLLSTFPTSQRHQLIGTVMIDSLKKFPSNFT